MTASDYVRALRMQPHPEGGYYAETYRSAETIAQSALPARFADQRSGRPFGTAIYFLLESHHVSHLHRIQADEIWHFYAGIPLNVYVIEPTSGELTVIRLGNNPAQSEVFQAVVPAGCWFGAKPAAGNVVETAPNVVDSNVVAPANLPNPFSLVGCTVAPGFDFIDFELADRTTLLSRFPQHRPVIELLTT